MEVRRLILVLAIFPALNAFGEQFHTYGMEQVAVFPNGSNTGEFGFYRTGALTQSSPRFVIASDGTFIVNDKVNDRIVILSEGNFEFWRVFPFPWRMGTALIRNGLFAKDLIMFDFISQGIHAIDRSGNTVFSYSFYENNLPTYTNISRYGDYVYFHGALFIQGRDDLYYCVPDIGPDAEANRFKLLGADETRERFSNGIDGITIDNQNRIFVNGKLATRNYRTFAGYWLEQNGSVPRGPLAEDLDWEDSRIAGLSFHYAGVDSARNVYWENAGYVAVFTERGTLLDMFVVESTRGLKGAAVDPAGNVYFLREVSSEDDQYTALYRVDRRW